MLNSATRTTSMARPAQRRMWALGALLAAGSAAFILSVNAWAGGEHHARGVHDGSHMVAGMPGYPGLLGGRHLERVLDRLEATPAQREQIKPIAEKAAADLKALHQEGRTLREQGRKLWAQPNIDAGAAETLRQQFMAHHDKVSKRMLQATIDVGRVLTPEQRAKLAERMQKRGGPDRQKDGQKDGLKDGTHHRHGHHGHHGQRGEPRKAAPAASQASQPKV